MVDGKICNALSKTPSMKCYICGAKPTEMNDIQKCVVREVQKKYFEFGLSPLNSNIRFFEHFLHTRISYKLKIKVWRARSLEQKLKILERKLNFETKRGYLLRG